MNRLILACVCTLLALSGCSKRPVLEWIPVQRLVEEGNEYRTEYGQYSNDGFIVASVIRHGREHRGYTPAEVQQLKGKLVMSLATWNTMEKLHQFRRTEETIALDGVPHVVIRQ